VLSKIARAAESPLLVRLCQFLYSKLLKQSVSACQFQILSPILVYFV